MDKLSDILSSQDLQRTMSQSIQQTQDTSRKSIVLDKSQSPEQSLNLRKNNEPKVKDCLRTQVQLTNLLYDLFQGQKKFGETAENMHSKVNFFKLMLGDYSVDQIRNAFMRYARSHDDIPAPANIIQLIENPEVVTYDNTPCSCGEHFGIGIIPAEERAKSYAWHRGRGVNYSLDKQVWLESYEKYHGSVL